MPHRHRHSAAVIAAVSSWLAIAGPAWTGSALAGDDTAWLANAIAKSLAPLDDASRSALARLQLQIERHEPSEDKDPIELSGDVFRAVLTSSEVTQRLGELPLYLHDLNVRSDVKTDGLVLGVRFVLERCNFTGALDLSHASIRDVRLRTTTVDRGVALQNARLSGGLVIDGKSRVAGLSLVGARVDGDIEIKDCELTEWKAADTDPAKGAAKPPADSMSEPLLETRAPLELIRSDVSGSVIVGPNVTVRGAAQFLTSSVEHEFALDGATILGCDSSIRVRDGLFAPGISVGGGLRIDRSAISGAVVLTDARVAQAITVKDSTIANASAFAFYGDYARVGRVKLLSKDFRGGIKMHAARVEDDVLIAPSILESWKPTAKSGRTGGPTAINLQWAVIGGSLRIGQRRRPAADAPPSDAFAKVDGNVELDGIECQRDLVIDSLSAAAPPAAAGAPPASPDLRVTLQCARVNGELRIDEAGRTMPFAWDLGHAQVRVLTAGPDRGRFAWEPRRLQLGGFQVDRIEGLSGESDTLTRGIAWVERDEESWRTGAYDVMAAVLRADGHEDAATEVLIARERARAAHLLPRPLAAVWGAFGYGYRPLRAVYGIVALTLLGWLVFRRGYLRGSVVPSNLDAVTGWTERGGVQEVAKGYPRFGALLFSFDALLPIIALGQDDTWRVAPPSGRGPWIRLYYSLHVVGGWALSTGLAISVANLFSR